jgi:hypothetical protein
VTSSFLILLSLVFVQVLACNKHLSPSQNKKPCFRTTILTGTFSVCVPAPPGVFLPVRSHTGPRRYNCVTTVEKHGGEDVTHISHSITHSLKLTHSREDYSSNYLWRIVLHSGPPQGLLDQAPKIRT